MLAAALVGLVAFSALALALNSHARDLNSKGSVRTIHLDIFWDLACTNVTSSIDWGMLEPGETKNVTFYLQNTGNQPELLSLTTQNWIPPQATDYIGLTWNREGETLQPNVLLPATLTLTVAPDIISTITTFSFETVIAGT